MAKKRISKKSILLLVADNYKKNCLMPLSASDQWAKWDLYKFQLIFSMFGDNSSDTTDGSNNPDLDGEMKDGLVEQIALSFLTWNYREMIIDPMMIIYWLKCIFKPTCYKSKRNIIYLRNMSMDLWRNCIKTTTLK